MTASLWVNEKNWYMGQVMKVRLSCYLVLLSFDWLIHWGANFWEVSSPLKRLVERGTPQKVSPQRLAPKVSSLFVKQSSLTFWLANFQKLVKLPKVSSLSQ